MWDPVALLFVIIASPVAAVIALVALYLLVGFSLLKGRNK